MNKELRDRIREQMQGVRFDPKTQREMERIVAGGTPIKKPRPDTRRSPEDIRDLAARYRKEIRSLKNRDHKLAVEEVRLTEQQAEVREELQKLGAGGRGETASPGPRRYPFAVSLAVRVERPGPAAASRPRPPGPGGEVHGFGLEEELPGAGEGRPPNGTYFSRKPFSIWRLASCLGFMRRSYGLGLRFLRRGS